MTFGSGRVEQALVHVHVDDLGAGDDLGSRATSSAGGIIARLDQLAEFGGARDIGALADIDRI